MADRSAERDAAAAKLAASMPADKASLLAVAKECVRLYNDAVLARADFAAEVIAERYDAVFWKLNGGSYFGCSAGGGLGSVLNRHFEFNAVDLDDRLFPRPDIVRITVAQYAARLLIRRRL